MIDRRNVKLEEKKLVWTILSPLPGLGGIVDPSVPAINRWAIIGRPYGTESTLWDWDSTLWNRGKSWSQTPEVNTLGNRE
jgi:hypothetical protein